MRLFLLFTLVPLIEVMLLVRIGGWLGAGPTLLIVVGTGAAGAWLARREGIRSWRAVQSELARGHLPTDHLVHAVIILVAGIVLITPGVITDVLGLLLLIPPVRSSLIAHLHNGFAHQIKRGNFTVKITEPFSSGSFEEVGRQERTGSTWPSGREILVEDESDLDR